MYSTNCRKLSYKRMSDCSEQNRFQPSIVTKVLYCNSLQVVDSGVDPEWTLLFYLRNKRKSEEPTGMTYSINCHKKIGLV